MFVSAFLNYPTSYWNFTTTTDGTRIMHLPIGQHTVLKTPLFSTQTRSHNTSSSLKQRPPKGTAILTSLSDTSNPLLLFKLLQNQHIFKPRYIRGFIQSLLVSRTSTTNCVLILINFIPQQQERERRERMKMIPEKFRVNKTVPSDLPTLLLLLWVGRFLCYWRNPRKALRRDKPL